MKILALPLLALLFSNSPAKAQACDATSAESHLLSVLAPDKISADAARCHLELFQNSLNKDNAASRDKSVNDRYSYQKMLQNSASLGELLHTTDNVVDKKVYVQGAEIFAAHARLIEAAEEEILFQTFYWESGSEPVQRLFRALKNLEAKRKADCAGCAPIVARFVINIGPKLLLPFKELFVKEGGPEKFADIAKAFANLRIDPRVIDLRVIEHGHAAFGSNHSKTLVVDNRVALITGANAQHYNDHAIGWYDLGFLVGGDVVKALRLDAIHALVRADLGKTKDFDRKTAARLGVPYERGFSSQLNPASLMAEPHTGVSIFTVARNGEGTPNTSNDSTMVRAFQAALQTARERVLVQSPNLNDDAAIRALAGARRNGAKLDLIVSKGFNCSAENQIAQGGQNEIGLIRLAGEFSERLPQGRGHDFRYFAARDLNGQRVVPVDTSNTLDMSQRRLNSHAKYMSIDGRLAIVGSANLDTQSWNQSREINLLVADETITQAWDRVIDGNFAFAEALSPADMDPENLSCEGKKVKR